MNDPTNTQPFSEEDLTVYLNGKPITRLNGVLAERQKVTKAQLIKLAVSIKNWLPRVTLRKSYGGLYV